MNFDHTFTALTGHSPFPWQRRLFERFTGKTHDGERFPACSLPTGLGKTSVIAVWLLALAASADDAGRGALRGREGVPRRLAYVVNRRTIVDQATREAEKLRENLKKRELREVHERLARLRGEQASPGSAAGIRMGKPTEDGEDETPLAISTLRGQFADNGEWAADPTRPAIIVGTVDMIGSRLLFSGYGCGFKARPLHAGFLGQDALLVHDEAHLEPAFQHLLDTIRREQIEGRCPDYRPLHVMPLTATPRMEGGEKPFELEKEDFEHDVIRQRLGAKKVIKLHPLDDERKTAEAITELALKHWKPDESDNKNAVLVFVRKIDDLKKVVDALGKAKGIDKDKQIAQLTGTMRGKERDEFVRTPVFQRFLSKSNRNNEITPVEGTVFLVCTSAGEVGVDISADHLVCDLTPFDSMAQRFGRVNRYGDPPNDAKIDIVHPNEFSTSGRDKEYQSRREKTLGLLRKLGGDGSPNAITALPLEKRIAAFSPMPTVLETTDILLDAWSMTSIRDRMPGRPHVEPYLHGIQDWEPLETHVAWREEVGVIVGDLLEENRPKDLLDEYPLQPHELLRDRTDRVWKELKKLIDRHPEQPIWIVDDSGDVQVVEHLSELRGEDNKNAEARIARKTILFPGKVGGLTSHGLLDGDHPSASKPDEDSVKFDNDVADTRTDNKDRRLRLRVWEDDAEFETKSRGMRHILCIDFPTSEDDDDAAKPSWHWFELPQPKDNSKNATEAVLLDSHVADVEIKAKQIVDGLAFDPNNAIDARIKQAILLAAKFHDLGKRRELWQCSIGRPLKHESIWFGKSGRRWKPRHITDYRHEFGSLIDLQAEREFQSLDDDAKDLVQHLIAAHHGQARPHFIATQIIDPHPDSKDVVCETLAIEVPRRFARLQCCFGRWGLAYLESILRAADWHASANPTSYFTEEAQ